MASRGIRNNNPGNIRKSKDSWRGLAPHQPDKNFFTFTSPIYGIRAIAKILINYERKHKLKTIRDLINRWAPPVENSTDKYVDFVAKEVGVDPDKIIDVWERLFPIIVGIIKYENGMNPYENSIIDAGIDLADMP